MNKYLYPIYKSNLKPWIKYWLYRKTSVKPVTGTYTLAQGQIPLTLTDSLVGLIKDLAIYGACYQAATPTPENPSEVVTLSGTINVTNTSGSQSYPIRLGDIELCKIGDYVDNIFYDNSSEKWYLGKNIGKVTLNGSETGWDVKNAGTVNWIYEISNSTLIPTAAVQNNQLCNRYLNGEIYNGNTNTGIMVLNSGHTIRIRYGTEDTANNFKTWLASHNVIVYYPLATPETTEITDTDLLSDLNYIRDNLSTLKGTNVISISGTTLTPTISLKYLKKD